MGGNSGITMKGNICRSFLPCTSSGLTFSIDDLISDIYEDPSKCSKWKVTTQILKIDIG